MQFTYKSLTLLISSLYTLTIFAQGGYFKIKIIDKETGRGVPLAEIKTTSSVRYFTDSNGLIAFNEPGLMNQKILFEVKSEGYEYPPDILGTRGVIAVPVAGDSIIIALRRINIAERLYRLTGEGIYRDSYLLGVPAPLRRPLLNGRVMGQDSNLGTVYRGKCFWVWGDTFSPDHKLGNLSVSAATSVLPQNGGLNPALGIDYTYFTDSTGFSRKMIDRPAPGYVWFDWLITIGDENGPEKLVAKYARVNMQFENYERGIAVFNDEREMFEKYADLDAWLDEYHTTHHPFQGTAGGERYYYETTEFSFRRVRPTLEDLANPAAYEAFTCLAPGSSFDIKAVQLERDGKGKLVYGWKANTDPVDIYRQQALIDSGLIQPEEGWIQLRDLASGEFIRVRRGSLYWNEYRQRWIMIAQRDVGEIWYAEGDTPVGPWAYTVMVANHDQQFYNPAQHPFFDQDNGRVIFFEGTYTNVFSPKPDIIPRYEYNQLMYRLTLDHPRLFLPLPVYALASADMHSGYQLHEATVRNRQIDNIQDIPFFAFAPGRSLPSLVAVYQHQTPNGAVLTTEATGEPLFYALPPLPQIHEQVIGEWQVHLTDGVFLKRDFELTIRSKNKELRGAIGTPGYSLQQISLIGDSLVLSFQYLDEIYSFTGIASSNKISGSWEAAKYPRGGTWKAICTDYTRFPVFSPAVVPLYRFQSEDKSTHFYAVSAIPEAPGYQRDEMPVCRVWRNPYGLLILDNETRPLNGY